MVPSLGRSLRTWHGQRRLKIAVFCMLVGAIGAVAGPLALFGSLAAIPESGQPALEMLRQRLGVLSFVVDNPWIKGSVARHPIETAMVLGFVVFASLGARFRNVVHDHFLAGFDFDALVPVRRIPVDDDENVLLEWILDSPGASPSPRRVAWDTLLDWARRGVNEPLAGRMSEAFLVGRTGSGKTRLAYELARSLARRDVLGGTKRFAKIRLVSGAYCRRVLPFVRIRDSDPWDAGLLRGSGAAISPGAFRSQLAGWRPRRPTILLLDDPVAGDTQAALEALHAAEPRYRHPVRLLVINQTLPLDVKLVWKPKLGCWTSESGVVLDPQPVTLPVESWFTREETVRILYAAGRIANLPTTEERSEACEHVLRITRGNPLLVQLAVHWLRMRLPVSEMAEDSLPTARVDRILQALRARGVGTSAQLAALAVATLAGGARASELQRVAKLPYFLGALEPAAQPDPRDLDTTRLRGCFPAEPLDATVSSDGIVLPAVKPTLIGDAFVSRVLEEILPVSGSDASSSVLVELAFCVGPANLLRRMRSAYAANSRLGRALRMMSPETLSRCGLDPVELAVAWADLAAICQPEDHPLSTHETRKAAQEAAERALATLDEESAARFCERFVQLCAIPPGPRRAQRQLRPDVALRLMLAADERCGAQGPGIGTWATFLHQLPRSAYAEDVCWPTLAARIRRWNLPGDAAEEEAFEQGLGRVGGLWDTRLGLLWGTLAERVSRQGAAARAARLTVAASLGDSRAAWSALERVVAVADGAPGRADLQLELARARRALIRTLAFIGKTPDSESLIEARRLRDLCEHAPKAVELFREAAWSYADIAYAFNRSPGGAGASGAREAADAVESLARRFPEDLEMHRAVADARRDEAWAWSEVPAGAGADRALEAAYAIEGPASRFRDDSEIQRSATGALSHVAAAFSAVPAGVASSRASAAADDAEMIARSFPEDPHVQLGVAEARTLEAFAWNQVAAGAGADRAGAAADATEVVARRFPDNPAIQRAAAGARAFHVYALSTVSAGAAAGRAEQACRVVEAIARRFADRSDFQQVLADALSYVAMSFGNLPAGAGASQASSAATEVEVLARRFPDVTAIQNAALEARCSAAIAWSGVPGGAAAHLAREAADTAAILASRFPDDLTMQSTLALARCREALAWSLNSTPESAFRARDACDAVEMLERRFPAAPNIQSLADLARSHAAAASKRLAASEVASRTVQPGTD